MKNLFLKKAIPFLRSLIPRNKETHRVLIVATTALGDTLWATPAIENLRRSFPKHYLAVLTSPIGLEIFRHNPHIDKLYCLKEPLSRHFFSLWRTLHAEHFDTILLFHASQRLTLPLCSLLGASRLIGTAGINKGLDVLLTDPLPNHAQHEIVRRLQIVAHYGAATPTQALSFFLQPQELLPPRSGRWIAIHPGSKDAFKRWPAERFIEVGNKLKETFDCNILITGTKDEKALMQTVAAAIPGAHLAETQTLRSFAALLNQMDLLISNDTGPVHLACALNRPVVALYSSTDPALCGPHQAPRALAIARRPTCDPCLKRKCRQPFCFLQIGTQEVLAASKKLLTSLYSFPCGSAFPGLRS
jgi:ADP-heptose:LPS heptosyltransferase